MLISPTLEDSVPIGEVTVLWACDTRRWGAACTDFVGIHYREQTISREAQQTVAGLYQAVAGEQYLKKMAVVRTSWRCCTGE